MIRSFKMRLLGVLARGCIQKHAQIVVEGKLDQSADITHPVAKLGFGKELQLNKVRFARLALC